MKKPHLITLAAAQPLKPAEPDEEKLIYDKRIALLDLMLSEIPLSRKKSLFSEFEKTVKKVVMATLPIMREYLNLPDGGKLNINVVLLTSSSCRITTPNGESLANGLAMKDSHQIGILNHLVLAPKEVLRWVLIHEILHYFYEYRIAADEKLCIADTLKRNYYERQLQEEQWVRNMTSKIAGNRDLSMLWTVAVEIGGRNWRPYYYKAKCL